VLCRAYQIIRIVRAGGIAILAFAATAMPAAAWERPHGDGANLNFANVVTNPAVSAAQTVSGIGTIPLGAGPVIAGDGTVYLANKQGEVIAIHADGTPYWRRKISTRQSIVASPAIGADGTIYVIGTSHATDHRVEPPVIRHDSSLHRFTASGGYLGASPFPQHDLGGAAIAPPNIWRFQGREMVVAPATYQRKLISTYDVRLIGFDPGGSVIADQIVSTVVPELFGGNGQPAWANVVCGLTLIGCLLGKGFERSGELPSAADGAGIFTFAGGGTPFVVISDGLHDVAGYTFSGGAFVESFRVHDTGRFMRSAPTILPDGHTIIGVQGVKTDNNGAPVGSGGGGAVFTGPNFNKAPAIGGTSPLYATPTRLADGRVLLLGYSGDLTVLRNNAVADRLSMPGTSMVSPAASQSHVFIATSEAFITLDAGSLAEVSRVAWTGGGTSQPAIGPKGHVYAVEGETLHVFAPGRQVPADRVLPESAPTAVSTSGADTKPYKPPLTMNGNRLFACEELDGDDCGKGDYQAIATAFCEKEGFIGAGQIEVDSKKGKAETLDGRFCSRKKCKVFEHILCANN
jgi:hypothetical protein